MKCLCVQDPVAFFRKVKEDTGVDFLNGLHGGTAASNLDTRNRQEEQFETYGLSPAFLRQLHITGPLTNRVFVSNVSFICYLQHFFSFINPQYNSDFHLAFKVRISEVIGNFALCF